MDTPFRMTLQTQFVLRAMLDSPNGGHYGLELSKATGLKAGTIYPMLARLEEATWIEGSWEDLEDGGLGRPPRRYYRFTDHGRSSAQVVMDDLADRLRATPA